MVCNCSPYNGNEGHFDLKAQTNTLLVLKVNPFTVEETLNLLLGKDYILLAFVATD